MMIKIPVADLDKVAHLAEVTAAPGPHPAATGHPRRVEAVRTPGGIRTHTVGGLSTVSLPLEYRGRRVERGRAGGAAAETTGRSWTKGS